MDEVLPSVWAALLQAEYELVRSLVDGSGAATASQALAAACELVDGAAPEAIRERLRALLAARELLGGAAEVSAPIIAALPRATVRGERAAMAAGHLIAACDDLLSGAFRHAYVRAREATAAAEGSGMADVAVLARIVGGLARTSLGEGPARKATKAEQRAAAQPQLPLPVPEPSPDVLALAGLHEALACGAGVAGAGVAGAGVAGANAAGAEVAEALEQLRRIEPRAGLPAIAALLCRMDHSRGKELEQLLPERWRMRRGTRGLPGTALLSLDDAGGLGGMRTRCGTGGRAGTISWGDALGLRAAGSGLAASVSNVEVSVLGSLAVTIAGRRMPETAWHRRHARTLLALLALKPGHQVSRHEAAQCFWPDSDYMRCREGMYTVLSSLRQTLAHEGAGDCVLGELGRLWLDERLVSCDIDEFELAARQVLAAGTDDELRVARCLRMDALWRGGPLLITPDASGFFHQRRAEIARRYVDALLAGVGSALAVGDIRQAIWFAESASTEAPERRDVALLLARAKGTGPLGIATGPQRLVAGLEGTAVLPQGFAGDLESFGGHPQRLAAGPQIHVGKSALNKPAASRATSSGAHDTLALLAAGDQAGGKRHSGMEPDALEEGEVLVWKTA